MISERREPLFNVPLVVVIVLGVLAAVQAIRGLTSDQVDFDMLVRFAFVPGRLTYAFDPDAALAHVARFASLDADAASRRIALARAFLDDGSSKPWTVITYALLHGSWAHLGANSLWLLAFGSPVARRYGTSRFLLILAASAIAGAAVHWLFFLFDFQPVVGASAAVSGCMGAAVRFMFGARRRIAEQNEVTEAPEAAQQPCLSLVEVFRDRRTLSFVAVWFLTNLAFGTGAFALGITDAPVAWQAHVGGFVAGLLMVPWLDRSRPKTTMPAGDGKQS